VTAQAVMPLDAGKTYVFAVGFGSNVEFKVSPAYCQGVVLILKGA
jgi:hypothetical protein